RVEFSAKHELLSARIPGGELCRSADRTTICPLGGLYGVTALVAAIAAWPMHPWMPRAFLVWSVAALLLGAFFLLLIRADVIWGGKSAATTFVLGVAPVSNTSEFVALTP